MKLFGFNITRAAEHPQPRPLPGEADLTMFGMPTMGNTLAKTPIDSGVTEIDTSDRLIKNDPRASYYWTMPSKITPQQALNMMRAALAGDVFQMLLLKDCMLETWPTLRMANHQLSEAASYMRYAVHPHAEEGKKPTKTAQAKADLVSRAMRAMHPNPFNDEKGFTGMAYHLCDAMLSGLSLVELLWDQSYSSEFGREWMPRAAAWVHPRHYTFSQDGFIALYTDGAERSFTFNNQDKPMGRYPDPEKFLCGQFLGKAGSCLGAGFMRPLVWYWAARQFNNEWMLNTAKQYGSPFIDITYKPGTVSTGPGGELEKLNEMLKTAGPQRRLLHPEGTLATIHPPTSLGKENPQRVLEEKADEACLFLLLGQKGTTTAVSGQLGNDDSHENVKEERKLGLANWLARNPLRQFARAVLRRNYGDDSECPEIAPDTTKPLKTEQVGQLATAISSSRIPIRADEFYKKIGFTQPEAGETVLAAGVISVQGEAMTDEERFEQDLQKQVAQGEAQIGLQIEAQGAQRPETARASEAVRAGAPVGNRNAAGSRGSTGVMEVLDKMKQCEPWGGCNSSSDESNFKRKLNIVLNPHGVSKYDIDDAFESHRRQHAGRVIIRPHHMAIARHLLQSGALKDDQIQSSDLTLRDALVHATDAELAELEAKLTAAEGAAHLNGEAAELEETVAAIEGRRW